MCASDTCQVCETRQAEVKLVASRLRDGWLLDAVLLCRPCAARLCLRRDASPVGDELIALPHG